MMALRVLNQISSIKLPKPSSIRSISADGSTRRQLPVIQPLKKISLEPKYKLVCDRRRSHSLPAKCAFKSNTEIYGNSETCVEEEKAIDEDLQVFKNRFISVVYQSKLPINYEQFSTKRSDEIENITKLAHDCYQKFHAKPCRRGYILKDSRKSNYPSPEVDVAFKKRYMHNDYISGSDLQPKNLCPFDNINVLDEETVLNFSTNPPINYYYTNMHRSKFLEKNRKFSERRNYTNATQVVESKEELGKSFTAKAINPDTSNGIKIKDYKHVPFKSYSDHIKETNQTSNLVPATLNQKRTFSMFPQAKAYKLDCNGAPTPISLGVLDKMCSSKPSTTTEMAHSNKSTKQFVPSSAQRFYLSRISKDSKLSSNENLTLSEMDEKIAAKYNCLPKINEVETLMNMKQSIKSRIKTEGATDVSLGNISTNNPMILQQFIKNNNIEGCAGNGKNRGEVKTNIPIDLFTNSLKTLNPALIEPVIKTTTSPVEVNLLTTVKPIQLQQTRNIRQSASYTMYNKWIFGHNLSETSTFQESNSMKILENIIPYQSKPKRMLAFPMTSSRMNYSTFTTDPHKTEKEETKSVSFKKSKITQEVLEKNKLDLFYEICDPAEKKYEDNKPCNCFEPFLPSKLPKLKRLKKKYSTNVDEYRKPPPECLPVSCPPRADDNLKETKKTLPCLPCSDCPCVQPPPLDTCNALPRLSKRFVAMDVEDKICVEDPCPERADAKLVEKKKCLKPLPAEPLDCKCIEPYLPTKLPKMQRLNKKVDLDEVPILKECIPPACPPRADEGLDLYQKKALPKIDISDCPCVEPSPLDKCSPLPRLKRRAVFQDIECIVEECPCHLKADDVCGYEITKKKLKPLLPCIKPTGYYKSYSTMSRSFLNVQVVGLKNAAVCDKRADKEVECKVPICSPHACEKPVPLCPPKQGLLDGILQKIINYFKARPNCPAPDEWKKRHLREKAEKAAKAAGLELCEPKCKAPQRDPCAGRTSVRFYSSSSGSWNKDFQSYFNNDAKLANELELKQLIYRILKLLRVDDTENISESCNELLKEFMNLSESEFQYINSIISDARKSLLYTNDGQFSRQKRHDAKLEYQMIEILDLFCKKASYLRSITYMEYEELEKHKTRTMQKKLDQMLDKYKIGDES